MPDKTLTYVQLAQDTARRITGSHTAWMAYLQTAARLYKYPYHEQLLIFAQRPQATACAGYEVWTNTMRRYVRRGAKGIALLDTSGDAPRLRYVFDVADTGELSQSRSLNLWKLSEENAQAVSLSLENGYDVPAREGLERQLRAILPPEESSDFCHRIVLFGREVCTARSPHCDRCELRPYCREFSGK